MDYRDLTFLETLKEKQNINIIMNIINYIFIKVRIFIQKESIYFNYRVLSWYNKIKDKTNN